MVRSAWRGTRPSGQIVASGIAVSANIQIAGRGDGLVLQDDGPAAAVE